MLLPTVLVNVPEAEAFTAHRYRLVTVNKLRKPKQTDYILSTISNQVARPNDRLKTHEKS